MTADWTDRYYIAFDQSLAGSPEATLALIRRLAEIIGLTSADADTFVADQIDEEGRYYTQTGFSTEFAPFVTASLEAWKQVIPMKAAEKGLEPLTPDEIALLRGGIFVIPPGGSDE